MEYGVQTHNKFAFLDEDVSDPEEILTKAEEEKKKAAANPQQKKTVVKPSVVQKPAPVKEVNKQVSSGPKVPSRPRRPQPNASQNQGFDAPNDKEKRMPNGRPRYDANKDDGGDGRPPRRNPPRGGGQSRGGASGPRGPRRPQREHTGENKAEEPNPNVNEVKTDENQVENTNVEAEQKTNDENVENAGEEGKEKQAEEENEDQVPRGKTLEEYRAEMNQKIVEAVQFNTRKAAEGDDQKIYQKLVPLKKPEQNKQEEEEDAQHVPKEKREKTLSIDVAFLDKRSSGRPAFGTDRNERPPPRGDRQGQGGGGGRRGDGGGGGGRGGYGGGGQRGPPRGNYGSGAAGPSNRRPPGKPNQAGGFTLETDQFPALGAK